MLAILAAAAASPLIVRAAPGAALVLAYRLARDLDQPRRGQTPSRVGRGLLAGVLAVVGVALAGGFALEASRGGEAPLVITGALGAIACWRAGRLRAALGLAVACALLRVEAWPFVALAGVAAWRRDPALRAPLAVLAVLVPAAWFVPEWLGSGDVLRSGSRARIPNPGQPALADVPALASLWAVAKLLLVPLWIGVVLALREPRGAAPAPGGGARLLAAAGGAWVLLVAAMAQAGFSGEPRYALPGVALLAVAGAAGLARAAARAEGAAVPVAAAAAVAL